MAGRIVNGGRAAYIFTATNGTTPTVGATPVLVLNDQISTDVGYDDTGTPSITINSLQDDELIETFRQTYCAGATVAGTPADINWEDGTTTLGASQSGTVLYIIVAGGTVQGSGASVGKKMSWHGFVGAAKSIGSFSQSGNSWNQPTLAFSGIAVEGTITVPSTYFTSVMVTGATTSSQALNSTTKRNGAKVFG